MGRLASGLALWPSAAGSAAKSKPNFVFFLIDDMGWKDLACYGSRFYQTPNIDRLAKQGMRFTDAYAAAPVCSPTRASILTGKYPARLGMTHITQWGPNRKKDRLIAQPTARELPLSEVTIAEALKTAGYSTTCIGKWHLGSEPFYPEHQGFDLNIGGGHIAETPDFFYPAWSSLRGNRARGVPIEGRPGEYLTDRLTDEALRFMESRKEQPFFLYLAHYAVHVPIQGKNEIVEKYRKKVRAGHPQQNPVYAAMVESVDESLGRVVAKLEELKLADHTVIILTSDNGGLAVPEGVNTPPPPTSNLPLRMGKLSLYEGGIREPLIVKWPGVVRPGSVCHVPVISNDFYPTMVEIAGIDKDPGNPVDGLSLAPLLRGTGKLNREALYWHYPHYGYGNAKPSSAVRRGNYKLQEFYEDGHLELYDLAKDIGERNNLAAKMPRKAAELRDMLHRWEASVGAKLPTLNPDYKRANP